MKEYNFMPLDKFFSLNSSFSKEDILSRDTLREFLDKELSKHKISDFYKKEEFPIFIVPRLAELGIFGCFMSDYGCPGISPKAYGLIMQELERCDSGLRSFASV